MAKEFLGEDALARLIELMKLEFQKYLKTEEAQKILDGKLDKVTTQGGNYRLYGIDGDGVTQKTYYVGYNPLVGRVPMYDTYGALRVGEPTADNHAVPLGRLNKILDERDFEWIPFDVSYFESGTVYVTSNRMIHAGEDSVIKTKRDKPITLKRGERIRSTDDVTFRIVYRHAVHETDSNLYFTAVGYVKEFTMPMDAECYFAIRYEDDRVLTQADYQYLTDRVTVSRPIVTSKINEILDERVGNLDTALDEIIALQAYYTGETFDELHTYAEEVIAGGEA